MIMFCASIVDNLVACALLLLQIILLLQTTHIIIIILITTTQQQQDRKKIPAPLWLFVQNKTINKTISDYY